MSYVDLNSINEIIEKQKSYFNSGETLSVQRRRVYLICLQKVLKDEEKNILSALKDDLGKHEMESYMTELGIVNSELSYTIKHMVKWAENKRVKTPLSQFKSKSYIIPEPYGTVLVMSPWNYPIQLSLVPLIGAIATGNTVVLKPSAYSSASSLCLKNILLKVFPEEYVSVILGGRIENQTLLDNKFDYIFFTGSPEVGKLVMSKASLNLTPVTLELGGKSPVIVDETADVKLSAKRVAFGKVLNAGQTCVAPDYLLIHKSKTSEFIKYFKNAVTDFFNSDYSSMPHIINKKHFYRIKNLILDTVSEGSTNELNTSFNEDELKITPALLTNVTFSSPVMREEIFGPVLPVIEFEDLEDTILTLKSLPKPLALYLFSNSKKNQEKVLSSLSFGGGCINDTIVHLASNNLGFGGVGNSGMGQYHGKKTFDTFTHYKSVLKKSNMLDLKMRYQPYSDKKLKLIRSFLK